MDMDDTNPYSWAQKYRALGWTTPLPLPYAAKAAVPEGYSGRYTSVPSDAQVAEWAGQREQSNIALRMVGVIGIDVDHYDRKTGADTLKLAEAKYGPLPDTWRSTARGVNSASFVRFFRLPPGVHHARFRDSVTVGGAGDIDVLQWGHRYAVAAPSKHDKLDAYYAWYRGRAAADPPAVADLPLLPDAWVEFLLNPNAVIERNSQGVSATDLLAEMDNAPACKMVEDELQRRITDIQQPGGKSRHDRSLAGQLALLELGVLGHKGVPAAIKRYGAAYVAELGPVRGWGVAEQEFVRGVNGAPVTETQVRTLDVCSINDGSTNDVDLARSWAATRPNARYITEQAGYWVVFKDGAWANDVSSKALARSQVDALLRDIAEGVPEQQKGRLLTASKLRSVVDAAEANTEFHAVEKDFEATDPWLFNVANGVLDLKTSTLRPHAPEYLQRAKAAVAWDKDASCPTWLRFLADIQPDHTEEFPGHDGPAVIAYIQELLGLALVGESLGRVFPVFTGVTSNGKTTILEVFNEILGPGYSTRIDKSLLFSNRQEKHATYVDSLRGRRFGFSTESGKGENLRADLVKELVGSDTLTAGKMRQDPTPFKPSHSLFLATNSLPVVDGQDAALWERVRVIKFPVVIPAEKRDAELRHKLLAEREGILRWAVEGLRRYIERGHRLFEPAYVTDETAAYRLDHDPFGEWSSAYLVKSPKAEKVLASELHASFRDFLDGHELPRDTVSPQGFYKMVEEWGGHAVKRTTKQKMVAFSGVTLADFSDTLGDDFDDEDSCEEGERGEKGERGENLIPQSPATFSSGPGLTEKSPLSPFSPLSGPAGAPARTLDDLGPDDGPWYESGLDWGVLPGAETCQSTAGKTITICRPAPGGYTL